MDENKIKISFDTRFYKKEAIDEAVIDFKEICESEISNRENIIEVFLIPKQKESGDILCYEFSNYVLGLMKNKCLV